MTTRREAISSIHNKLNKHSFEMVILINLFSYIISSHRVTFTYIYVVDVGYIIALQYRYVYANEYIYM